MGFPPWWTSFFGGAPRKGGSKGENQGGGVGIAVQDRAGSLMIRAGGSCLSRGVRGRLGRVLYRSKGLSSLVFVFFFGFMFTEGIFFVG